MLNANSWKPLSSKIFIICCPFIRVIHFFQNQKQESGDFPGGAVVKYLLPMQGTQVRALVQEDPTCCGATKPMRHNYWAWALKPVSHNYWVCVPQLLSPCATTTEAHMPRARALQQREATAMRSPCTTTKSNPLSLQLEKGYAQQRRPNAAKKLINFLKKARIWKSLLCFAVLESFLE